jgi:hypothetical protein
MKKTQIIILFLTLLFPAAAFCQGLDGIVVEKYYSTNAADAANASAEGAVTTLNVGSTVYRVYVDMAAGYKFSTLYGNAAHNLTVNTTTNFYNDPNYGVSVNPGSISLTNIGRHTALIDSWFGTGGTCVGKAGVMKSEDTDGSITNVQGILANNAGGCFGLPIQGAGSQDGMLPSNATTQVTPNTLGLGVGNALLSALDQTPGNSILISNGSIAALGGVVGPTASNRVLVGQFTTDGEFTFQLNVQIIHVATNTAYNYVASSPVGAELTHPSLTRTANTPPVVAITSPANAASFVAGNAITINANASDNGSVSSVAFYVDGNLISTDTSSPFSATYVGVLGNHVLTAVATDNDCTTTTSSSVNISVTAGTTAPANDNIASAIVVSNANSWYPQCAQYSGNLSNSTNSSESSFNGPDNWYRFVASTPAVSIEMTGATMDNMMELVRQTGPSTYVSVDTENANPGVGAMERLNYNGLVIGDTYFVACGTTGTGGAFTVCIKQLLPSGCNTNTSSPLNNCTTFKPMATGANSYAITFNPIGGSIGGGTATVTGSSNLSNPLFGVIPGNTYNVIVNANYNLTNNAPTPVAEPITVFGANPSCANVVIAAHSDIQVRASQRCIAPATLQRASYLRSDPFVCGVTNYTFRFTPVVSCADNTPTGISFTVTNASRNIGLNFPSTVTTPSGQTILNQTYYLVEVRPNFGIGGVNPGTFGTGHIIFVGGTTSEITQDAAPSDWNQASALANQATVSLYPNPTNQNGINLELNGVDAELILVQIFDQNGRLVLNQQITMVDAIQTYIEFPQLLADGIYNVNLNAGGQIFNERILVQR